MHSVRRAVHQATERPRGPATCRRMRVHRGPRPTACRCARGEGTAVKRAGKSPVGRIVTPREAPSTTQSLKTMFKRELCTRSPPLYSMKPSFLNLFMNELIRGRVVPTSSARVS